MPCDHAAMPWTQDGRREDAKILHDSASSLASPSSNLASSASLAAHFWGDVVRDGAAGPAPPAMCGVPTSAPAPPATLLAAQVLDDLCRGSLAQGGPASPASSVVLVVGRSHLDGLRFLWAEQRWQGLVGAAALSDSQLMSVPQPPKEDVASRGAGVRRGLLHAMMRQMVTQECGAGRVLGARPAAHGDAADGHAGGEVRSGGRGECVGRGLLHTVMRQMDTQGVRFGVWGGASAWGAACCTR
eukprot:350786-Chlamydomonas_euryale.AAC.2